MVLVTGGTGFVGTEIVRELRKSGYPVRVLVRNPESSAAQRLERLTGVEIVEGDLLDPGSLVAACKGVDVIINLVGILLETANTTFEQAHVEGTRNLVGAASTLGVSRFVQMSALGTRPEARSRYHLSKWEAEEIVRHSGLAYTIFRPSIIYGKEDHCLRTIATLFGSPLLGDLRVMPNPGGDALVQPVPVSEVAHCFVRAIANRDAVGKTFDIVGPERISWRHLMGKLADMQDVDYEYEDFPLATSLRLLLWTGLIGLPAVVILLLVLAWLGQTAFPSALTLMLFGGGWLLLLAILAFCRGWRILTVPDLLLVVLTFPSQFMPIPALRFYDQIKLLQEDNVGDPQPAGLAFGYEPIALDQGLSDILQRS